MYINYVRPVESHSGARETILAGPYHNLRMCRDRDAEGVERYESQSDYRGLGSVVSSPSGVAENGFFAYLR